MKQGTQPMSGTSLRDSAAFLWSMIQKDHRGAGGRRGGVNWEEKSWAEKRQFSLLLWVLVLLPQGWLYLEILGPWPPTLVQERNDDGVLTPASSAEVSKLHRSGKWLWLSSAILPPTSQIRPTIVVQGRGRACFPFGFLGFWRPTSVTKIPSTLWNPPGHCRFILNEHSEIIWLIPSRNTWCPLRFCLCQDVWIALLAVLS